MLPIQFKISTTELMTSLLNSGLYSFIDSNIEDSVGIARYTHFMMSYHNAMVSRRGYEVGCTNLMLAGADLDRLYQFRLIIGEASLAK
jgi:hypothetical protein